MNARICPFFPICTRSLPHGGQAGPRQGPCRAAGVVLCRASRGVRRFPPPALQGREAMYRSIPVPKAACGSTWAAARERTWNPSAMRCPRRGRSTWSISATRCWRWRGNGARPADGRTSRAAAADATTFQPDAGKADVVTFSYSLTMIPDWFAAIDNALAMLRPAGRSA